MASTPEQRRKDNNAAAARYRARNPEKHRAAVNRWRAENAAAVREYRRTYVGPPLTDEQALAAAQRHAVRYVEDSAYAARMRASNRANYARNRDTLADLKASPCVDCGVQYPPCVMEFDHVRGTKHYAIGAHKVTRADFAAELAKCELRCSNCHRMRHDRERHLG